MTVERKDADLQKDFGLENPTHSDKFITKDSGVRQNYDSGMTRDLQSGKPMYDLCIPQDCPKDSSMLYRWAMLMERGMSKYGYRNWEKANSEEELIRFKQSAFRHFMQWFNNWDTDEDHAAAVFFNVQAWEWLNARIGEKKQ